MLEWYDVDEVPEERPLSLSSYTRYLAGSHDTLVPGPVRDMIRLIVEHA
jgi:hypothetical protein